MSSSEKLYFSFMGSSTAGRTPLAPAVGAATMRPMQALHSPTFNAVAMTVVSTGPHRPI